MKTMKHNKWWILLLSMVFVVIGMACSSDEPDENYEYRGNHKYYPSLGRMFLQLDKKDDRFKDLKTIDELKDVRYDIETSVFFSKLLNYTIHWVLFLFSSFGMVYFSRMTEKKAKEGRFLENTLTLLWNGRSALDSMVLSCKNTI